MSQKKRILSISNDAALMATRKMLLEEAGFEVVCAFGFAEAMELCSRKPFFDLVLMGQTLPPRDKRALIGALRELGCKAPVLSIRRQGDEPLAEVDFTIESQAGPVALIETARAALGISKGARSSESKRDRPSRSQRSGD